MNSASFKSGPRLLFADATALEVKAEASGRIEGYGAVFGNVDSYGERVLKGAFAASLADNARRGFVPKMLWQHDQGVPIGRWSRIAEDDRGLYVEGHLNLKTTNGRDAYEHLLAGDVDGMSIGYREKRAQANREVRDLLELELFEVSVVVFPANPQARVDAIKSVGSKAELIDRLRAGGLSKQAAGLVAAGGWKALSKTQAHDHDAVARLAASIDHATRALKDI